MLFKGKWSGARSSYAGYDEYEPGLSVELNHVYKWSEQRCFGHARRTLVRSLCSRNGAQRSHPVLYSSSRNHFIYIYISVALYICEYQQHHTNSDDTLNCHSHPGRDILFLIKYGVYASTILSMLSRCYYLCAAAFLTGHRDAKVTQ